MEQDQLHVVPEMQEGEKVGEAGDLESAFEARLHDVSEMYAGEKVGEVCW